MKKAQRKHWLTVMSANPIQRLCFGCRHFIQEGCNHPIEAVQDSGMAEAAWADGHDCWAFRPAAGMTIERFLAHTLSTAICLSCDEQIATSEDGSTVVFCDSCAWSKAWIDKIPENDRKFEEMRRNGELTHLGVDPF